jgi:hypothetical protein
MIHKFVGRLLLENIYEQICMKNVWWGRGSGEAKSPRNNSEYWSTLLQLLWIVNALESRPKFQQWLSVVVSQNSKLLN